jgi:hypothetical protein
VATKADDAKVPEYLWNDRIHSCMDSTIQNNALHTIRLFALWWLRRKVQREFLPWFKHRYPILIMHDINQPVKIKSILKDKEESKDWLVGRECIEKCSDSSWWEWDRGSRPQYWQWKEDYLNVIHDGLPWYYSSTQPHYLKPQRHEADEHIRLAI